MTRTLRVCLLAGFAAMGAGEASGQASPNEVDAFLEVGGGWTSLLESNPLLIGGAAGLHLGSSWSVGGAGFIFPSAVEAGTDSFQELELQVGYGGVLFEWRQPEAQSRPNLFGRALLGAGSAELRDVDTGITVGTDSFILIEPEIGMRRTLFKAIRGSASVSYRYVDRLGDLRDISSADLRGFSLRIVVQLSPL